MKLKILRSPRLFQLLLSDEFGTALLIRMKVLRFFWFRILRIPVEPITCITIETTTYCNRRCSYCPNSVFERSSKKNTQLMNPALFRKIIDDLAEVGFKGQLDRTRIW